MAERKPLHPKGVDNLRAAVVGRAIVDYANICRGNRRFFTIPYYLTDDQIMDIRRQYCRYHRDPTAIAADYKIPVNKVIRIGEGFTNDSRTTFIEDKSELEAWFESEDFNYLWCNEPGKNITAMIKKKVEDKKKKRSTPPLIVRKKSSQYNEEMGV